MEINRPHAQPPTQEELQDLDKLRTILEQAIADGIVTEAEVKLYKTQAWKDGRISAEELTLYQELVLSKITSGELRWDRD